MSAFWTVVRKELNSVIRDRTIIIAILIQLFIASFSSALLIGMLSLYDADSVGMYGGMNLPIGLISPPGSSQSNLLSDYLKQRGVNVLNYGTLPEAKTDFYRSRVMAIIMVLPDNGNLAEMKLFLPRSEATASLIRMVIQEPLKRYENALRAQRGVEVRYTDLTGKPSTSFEFIYSVILPMLMFFPAFVAGGMVVDTLSEEVENNTLQTLLSAPISINGIVLAKVTSAVLLAVIQCLAWLGLLRLNHISVQNAGWVLLLAAIVSGLVAVGSALVTVLFRDRERSQFVYSLALLVAASLSYLLDLSPIKVISRLATGDFYTGGWDVAVFGLILAAMVIALVRFSRHLAV